jgi:predicted RNase H-like HicB family nuclease
MSGRRKSSAGKDDAALPLDRPFPPGVQAARQLVARYHLVLWFEEGEWYGRGLEYPHALGDGKTPDACVASVRESLAIAVATTLESGHAPPVPAEPGGESLTWRADRGPATARTRTRGTYEQYKQAALRAFPGGSKSQGKRGKPVSRKAAG